MKAISKLLSRSNCCSSKLFFHIILIAIFSIIGTETARKTTSKGSPHGSEKIIVSAMTPFDPQTCKPPDSLSEMRKNITNFQKSLKYEMERRLESLSDMIDQLMQEQTFCLNEKDKQLLAGPKCSQQISESPQKKEIDTKIPICDTPKCKEIASRMLHTIDHSMDPCQDFYQYACGNIEKDSNLQPINPYQEALIRIREKLETVEENNAFMGFARTFYETCNRWHSPISSSKSISYAREVVRKVGWFLPSAIVGKSFKDDFSHLPLPKNLTFYLATFMKSDFAPFFDLFIEPDPSNKQIVPRISLSLNSFQLSEDIGQITCIEQFKENIKQLERAGKKSIHVNDEYKKYIDCQKKGLGLAVRLQQMSESISTMNLMDFMKNQTSRDELMQDTRFSTENLLIACSQNRPPTISLKSTLLNKDYQVKKIKDLKDELSQMIDWEEFFFVLTDQKFPPDQKIHVYHQKEVAEILKILGEEWIKNNAAVHNSLLMLWSDRVYSSLVEPLQVSSDYCLKSTLEYFPDISSLLYLHSFPDAPLAKLQRHVTLMANSLHLHVERLISTHYSAEFKKKINHLKMNIGATYDTESMNDTLIHNIKDLTMNTSDHAQNVNTLLLRKRRILYSLINEDAKSQNAMWMQGIVPYNYHGYSSHELNEIYLPYGMFFPPYLHYYNNREILPEYIAYGGLGHQMAIQMMALFDETGSKHDGESKTNMTMPIITVLSSECFANQILDQFRLVDKDFAATYEDSNRYTLNDLLVNSWATRLGWSAYLAKIHRNSKVTPAKDTIESPEKNLIWMGSTPLKPIKAYFLRIAQAQCSKSSEFDLLRLMEDERMLPRHRVNLIMRNEKLFADAFQCPPDSLMSSYDLPCQFIFE